MKKNLRLIASAAAMMLLILDSRACAVAAAQALEICIRTVIPSLFQFFVLSGYLTQPFHGGRWIARIFRMNGNCGSLILMGLLSGYPVGAKSAAEGYQSGYLSKQQADRLLFFCSQAGPSFLFGIVAAQFDKLHYAWALWAIQICSSITVANLIPGQDLPFQTKSAKLPHSVDSMGSALHAMGAVCGWVIVFSVFLQFLNRWVLWLLPPQLQILLQGLLELTSGCLMLTKIDNVPLRFLFAAVMLNFGGLCVLLQTVSVSSVLKIKNYILGKILQTMVALLYALLFLGVWPALIPIVCIFLAKAIGIPAKKGSIPAKNGV